MIRAILGAVQFLTVVPVRGRTAPPGQSAVFFPLIGALLGVGGGVILKYASAWLPVSIAALLTICFWVLITGGLHEDGFADCADAFRAGRPRERIFAILKDSRIGAHGALALVLSSLIRWQALGAITVDPIPALGVAHGISRAAAVGLAWFTPPAGTGLGLRLSTTMTTPLALVAIAQGVLLAAWCGGRLAGLLTSGTFAIVWFSHRYFVRRIGGVTGDCMGAVAHIVEIFVLVVFACRSCIS
jgi:adenosylcobinamide-GDP ribazoletransferase